MDRSQPLGEKVRRHTPRPVNDRIDSATLEHLREHATRRREISERIVSLDREWDLERVLDMNMAVAGLLGVALALFLHIYWLALSAVVLLFFLQYALQGWCPPVPLFRRLGYRIRPEIDREKYALKAMRGDFEGVAGSIDRAVRAFNAVWKI